MTEKKQKGPEFAPGFEPAPDPDLDDPTIAQEALAAAPVAVPAPAAVGVGDVAALIGALTGLVAQLQNQIGQSQTSTILADMGSKILSVEKIDVPAFVLANVKGFDTTPHYLVKDELRYPQMGNRDPLIRTRGLPAEKLTEMGIAVPE